MSKYFFQWTEHPVSGPTPVPGVAFRVGGDGARVRGAAPLVGQHNEEVVMGLLGVPRERYDHLVATGSGPAMPLPAGNGSTMVIGRVG